MRVIHVVGCERSGTTLLQSVLCMDPAAAPLLGEAFWPLGIAELAERMLQQWDDDTHYFFGDRTDVLRLAAASIEAFAETAMSKHEGAELLVLKHPGTPFMVRALRACRPDDLFIGLVRDPRDIVASKLNAFRRMSPEEATPQQERQKVEQYAQKVSAAYRCIAAEPGLFTIRYEELVTRFEDTVDLVNRELGLDIPRAPSAVWDKREFDFLQNSASNQRHFASPGWGQPVSSDFIGRYATSLDATGIRTVEAICGLAMQHFSYR